MIGGHHAHERQQRLGDERLVAEQADPQPANTPRGFLYELTFPGVSQCLLESIGPDMT